MGLTKKQKEVLDFIKEFTTKNEISPTQREIKEHFGLKSYGSVQRYLKYLKEAKLLEQDWNSKRGLKILTPDFQKEVVSDSYEVPLLGDVAAGNPIEAIENCNETLSIPKFLIPSRERHFALNIQGDSMIEDGILDGDVAICRQQITASEGETVVAVIDNEATLKKFYQKKNHIELHPANARLSPIIVSPEQHMQVVGKLVALFRRY
jgi:repressor LexA